MFYRVFSGFLVVLALAFLEQLEAGAPALARTTTVFGLIWAGLMFASGMVANVGIESVVDLQTTAPERAATASDEATGSWSQDALHER